MLKGKIYSSEERFHLDERSGLRLRQVTDHPSTHHQPFFFVPAYDRQMMNLFFISFRTGAAQIFCEQHSDKTLKQLTDRDDLHEWSVYPSRNGRFVFFTAGNGAWRLDLETLKEEELVNFGDAPVLQEGMVGTSMGTTALSWDDRFWAVPVKWGHGFRFYVIDTQSGDFTIALEQGQIGHPQFCPDDNDRILYIAGMIERVWVVSRDGSYNKRIYSRNEEKNEWITHESWLPGTGEITFVDWPHAVRAIHAETGQQRTISRFNAWHAMANWDGSRMVADTNFPDIGLHLFDPRQSDAEHMLVCYPQASSIGAHWAHPFPYADGPVKVYAPQHTHPHPSFSPDDRRLVFTSDRTGESQIYECLL